MPEKLYKAFTRGVIQRADTWSEIIERSHIAAVRFGEQAIYSNTSSVIYSLRLDCDDVTFHISWIGGHENLWIWASIHSLGHGGSKSILNLCSTSGHITWHCSDYNDLLLERLRRLMVLDDIAGV